jgi:cyanophycinase
MKRLLVALLLVAAPVLARPHRHLVLIGGGVRPAAALSRFVEWGGGARAHILVVAWATEQPAETLAGLQKDLPGLQLYVAATERVEFLRQLQGASAVYFTGGDQKRIMRVLQDPEMLKALRACYRDGTAFAGTSAGTAVMSQLMLEGEGNFEVVAAGSVVTGPGLGLLPANVVVDQHFIKRQRENRLFSVVMTHPGLRGIGIDEGTALLVTDDHEAEVVGPTQVLVVDSVGPNAFTVRLQPGGSHFKI